MMQATIHRSALGLLLAAVSFSLSGCGLVKMPFKVAGAVADGAYQGGKKAVDASSRALEKRKQKKQKEEEEKAKAEAKQQQSKPVDSLKPAVNGGPAIPLGTAPQPLLRVNPANPAAPQEFIPTPLPPPQ